MLLDDKLILIFEEFLRDFTSGFTGSFIANKKKLNQKTVSNYLIRLENKKILFSKFQGRNKLYYLNLENYEIVKNFILLIESSRTIYFFKDNPLIKEIIFKINPFIQGSAVIFGSYVKKLNKQDSDLDVFIFGKCDREEINKISEVYNLEINLKIYSKLSKKDFMLIEVLKNHIFIKNSEMFINEVLNEKN